MKTCELVLISSRKNIPAIDPTLKKIESETNFDKDKFRNLEIAVSEIVANSIVHGNKENPNKKVSLVFCYDENMIEVKISDEGNGFNMQTIPDPTEDENIFKESGRGIYIAKSLVDEFSYKHTGKGSEFVVKIYKNKQEV
jgi:serine/threonine-protein kinase RsbW